MRQSRVIFYRWSGRLKKRWADFGVSLNLEEFKNPEAGKQKADANRTGRERGRGFPAEFAVLLNGRIAGAGFGNAIRTQDVRRRIGGTGPVDP